MIRSYRYALIDCLCIHVYVSMTTSEHRHLNSLNYCIKPSVVVVVVYDQTLKIIKGAHLDVETTQFVLFHK